MHLSNSSVTSGIDRWDLVNYRKGFSNFDSVGEASILTDILGEKITNYLKAGKIGR